ncbi:acyl transferase carnitine dehydratase [Fusarium coicis]|nr:acyl transferase carnitine dehydratase [Fusarium coicis]
MSQEPRIPEVYGPGTHTDRTFVPVPQDTQLRFTGDEFPVISDPIKAVSVAAALHAMAGVVADEILTFRGVEDKERQVTVNTSHAGRWFGNVATAYVDITPLKYRTTGLYPTSDPGVWYSLHGSTNAEPVLKSIGVDPSETITSNEEAAAHIAKFTRKLSPEKLEFTNLVNGNCGSICFTPKQWNESEMGISLAAHPLINIKAQPQAIPTPLVAFPPLDPDDKRPLAGIKVVEITRVIAGPQIGTILSSSGADVIRVNPPHLPDINIIQLTLHAGKRTIAIDLRKPEDVAIIKSLIADADVFIQGFRMNKMPKFGLGLNDILKMAGERGRGIVHVSENSGSAYVTIRSLNLPNNEAVLPSLPISDMTTGALGAVGTLLALRDRATKGGSYAVHGSLVAANAFALRSDVGLYSPETVAECAERFQWSEMRGSHHVLDLLMTVWDA